MFKFAIPAVAALGPARKDALWTEGVWFTLAEAIALALE